MRGREPEDQPPEEPGGESGAGPAGRLKRWSARLKSETYALYLAYRHPGVPWHAKLFAAAVVAYAVSPIDLIPDFIPGLGYLDDLILVPLGIALALRMIPAGVMEECRARADGALMRDLPGAKAAAAVVVAIWLLLLALVVFLVVKAL